jgi:hypothetical protein
MALTAVTMIASSPPAPNTVVFQLFIISSS